MFREPVLSIRSRGGGAFGAKLRTVLQLYRLRRTDMSYLVLLKDNGLPRSEKEQAMVVVLDSDSLLYRFIGDTVTVENIKGAEALKPRAKVDVNTLVTGRQEISRKELLGLCKSADIPRSSADRYLKSLPMTEDGRYILNN